MSVSTYRPDGDVSWARVTRSIVPGLSTATRSALDTCRHSSTYSYTFALNRRIIPDDFMSLFIPATADSLLTLVFDENAGSFGRRGPAGTGLMKVSPPAGTTAR